MGFEEAFDFVTDSINGIGINDFLLLPILIPLLSLFIITRDVAKWKKLALPIFLMWKFAGLDIPLLYIIIAAIIAVIELFNNVAIGEIVTSMAGKPSAEKAARMKVLEGLKTKKYKDYEKLLKSNSISDIEGAIKKNFFGKPKIDDKSLKKLENRDYLIKKGEKRTKLEEKDKQRKAKKARNSKKNTDKTEQDIMENFAR